jgi:hypothetical protein
MKAEAMKRSLGLPMLAALAAAAAACGGTEPLSVVLKTNGQDPQLTLPISVDLTNISQVSPYNGSGATVSNIAVSDGLNLLSTGITATVNVGAPADGIVSAVDNTQNAAAILIYHTAHLSTRISRLASVSVQPGAIVQQGALIGTANMSPATTAETAVHFTVYHDTVAVCPSGFLTSASADSLVNRITSNLPPCL